MRYGILAILLLSLWWLPALSRSPEEPMILITTSRDTVSVLEILPFRSDTLHCISGTGPVSIVVDSIAEIVLIKESHFWTGALIGAPSGLVLGGLVGVSSSSSSWLPENFFPGLGVGLLGGFFLGGLTGALQGNDQEVDLSGLGTVERIMRVRAFIAEIKNYRE